MASMYAYLEACLAGRRRAPMFQVVERFEDRRRKEEPK